MKDLGKKGILLFLSMVLLCCVLLYMSFAWYTKMTSVGGMNFKAAKWDFSANYQVDDFIIDVNSYLETTINPKLAAPGTEGKTGLKLRSENADTAVAFVVSVDKSTMSPGFQDRIFFYFIDESGEKTEFVTDGIYQKSLEGEILPNGEVDIDIYWRWAYDYDEILQKNDPEQYETVQILKGFNAQDREFFLMHPEEALAGQTVFYNLVSMTPENRDKLNAYKAAQGENFVSFFQLWSAYTDGWSEDPEGQSHYDEMLLTAEPELYEVIQIIQGYSDVPPDGSHLSNRDVLFTYESRVLSGESLFTDGVPTAMEASARQKLSQYQTTTLGETTFQSFWEDYLSREEAHNHFDTLAGSNTLLYESQMRAMITVTGEQVIPVPIEPEPSPEE